MFKVDKERCVGCEVCVEFCPREAISMVNNKAQIDANKCVDCGRCAQVCPRRAIYPGMPSQQSFSPSQEQMFPNSGFGMGYEMPARPGDMGRGMGRGLGRGPRDGRGRRRGGGVRRGR